MATRWGICAAGLIAHDFVTAVRTLPSAEHTIAAVAARSSDRARDFASRHSISKAYGSYEDLAKDPDIDVVYVGTVHTTHVDVASLMMKWGKSILCEKPLAVNLKEARQLTSLAREKNVFLMEALWSRFFPAWIELENQIKSGAIGDIKLVTANFGIKLGDNPSDRYTKKELAGGALLDLGVYPLSFASFVLSGLKPDKVVAAANLMETGVDKQVGMTLVYPSSKIANLCVSFEAESPRDAYVIGTKGIIKVPYPFWCPTKLETPSGVLEYPLPKSDTPFNYQNSAGLSYEAAEVRRCLQAGKKESDRMPLSQSEMVMGLMDEIRRQVGVEYPQDM